MNINEMIKNNSISYFLDICSDPGSINNGKMTGSAPYHQGSSVTYKCNNGYTMNGDNTLTCQSEGTWDKPAPTCITLSRAMSISIALWPI